MQTWDEAKRKTNLSKHAIDFIGCESIFDNPTFVFEDQSKEYGEQRLIAIGWLNGEVVFLVYTERGEVFHVISLRKALKHEIKQYIKEVSK